MKKISQLQISKLVGISPGFLSDILNGKARSSWPTAKRLSVVVTGSTPVQWMEAPPETLRQIISEFALSRGSTP